MKPDHIIAAIRHEGLPDRATSTAPDAGCPRWVPLVLLASASVYPLLGWLAYSLLA